ncbi:hypothetical protein EPH_0019900 [Eimeria praecox]|uniref:Uncharacterized protein n=1 Tax=Eimeria praecox TaxID=51316 RepID=U6G7A3_9EIME|nr:hypothetical protein EPH_0019900 [Eimeria praecox]
MSWLKETLRKIQKQPCMSLLGTAKAPSPLQDKLPHRGMAWDRKIPQDSSIHRDIPEEILQQQDNSCRQDTVVDLESPLHIIVLQGMAKDARWPLHRSILNVNAPFVPVENVDFDFLVQLKEAKRSSANHGDTCGPNIKGWQHTFDRQRS